MLGFMFTTMFISMWISNTATTAMMLPIVDAVVQAINQKDASEENEVDQTSSACCKVDAESEKKEKATFICGDNHEFEDDDNETKALLDVDTNAFENELKQLTKGKILNIEQLNNLLKLDDGCGHFEDLSTIAKVPTSQALETMEKKESKTNLPRTKTMKRLKAQQEIQKQIRNTPIKSAKSVQQQESMEVGNNEDDNRTEIQRNFLLIGIAMSSNIGGTGVVTGTPPNLVAPDILQKKFGDGTGLTFASWMAFSIPVMIVNIILAWLWLQKLMQWSIGRQNKDQSKEREEKAMKAINKKYEELGKMSVHELQVMILFMILILLWFFKTPIFIPGWGDLFAAETSAGVKISIAQATPAILICLLLFVLPQNYNFWPFSAPGKPFKKSPSLITWRLIETKMPWGVLFLLGGGFTLAKCLQTSGLSIMLVAQLNKLNLTSLPGWLASIIFTGLTVVITNLCNNTATANALVPILADMSINMCLNPILLTVPAAIACSYAFALPVSTAPNAIVFGHSTMKTVDMVKAGMMMNVICFSVLVLAINTYAVPMFDLHTYPDWAVEANQQCINSTFN